MLGYVIMSCAYMEELLSKLLIYYHQLGLMIAWMFIVEIVDYWDESIAQFLIVLFSFVILGDLLIKEINPLLH
jgi:hypothetical protein